LVTWIAGFLLHIAGYDTETWIFHSYYCTAGYWDGTVMFPHVGTYIFGFLRHAKGYCDGAVTYFVMGLLPCAAVCFLPS
jgi:hypothetical protein